MLLRTTPRPTTIESLHDEELAQLEHASPSPWNDATTESFLLAKSSRASETKTTKSTAINNEKPKPKKDSLPVIPNNNAKEFVRRARLSPRTERLDSSAVAKAYNDLVAQTESMAITRTANMHRRYLHEQALVQGIQQLSAEHVQHERELIRFNTLKNEVDIFQQFLDPFVFEMRTPREHSVYSSVYRHFTRMQGIQDMGIPIYSLGDYMEEPDDKIMTPRTVERFYHRIRRRTAADFMDASLVSRPSPRRPKQRKDEDETHNKRLERKMKEHYWLEKIHQRSYAYTSAYAART